MQKGWVRPWAFPQSPVAKFDFVHFPIKKYGWGVWFLDPAFDGFCGTPFIYFLCCMVTVTAVKTHLHEILRRERWIWTIGSNVVALHLHLPSQVVIRLFHSFVYCGPFFGDRLGLRKLILFPIFETLLITTWGMTMIKSCSVIELKLELERH